MEGGEAVQLDLLHVLNNQCLLPVFRIYCQSKQVEEYLSFWFDVRELTIKYSIEKKNQQQETADVRKLFHKYFQTDSIYHIEIEPNIGNELQTHLSAEQVSTEVLIGEFHSKK